MTGGYRLKHSQTAKKLTLPTEGNDPCYLLASSCLLVCLALIGSTILLGVVLLLNCHLSCHTTYIKCTDRWYSILLVVQYVRTAIFRFLIFQL
jgi:hypothetical protein